MWIVQSNNDTLILKRDISIELSKSNHSFIQIIETTLEIHASYEINIQSYGQRFIWAVISELIN